MRCRQAFALAILTTTVWADESLAGWKYLQWGMTPQEAITASKGEARFIRAGDDIVCVFNSQKPFAIIPKEKVGDFWFKVALCSDSTKRLSSVGLDGIDSPNVYAVKRALLARYGKPISDANNTIIWIDKKAGNTITYATISDIIVKIEYKKLPTSGF